MSVLVAPWRFTVDDYHRMEEAGIFHEDDRVELIEGEIVAMSPIGSRHAACVERLGAILRNRIGERFAVRVQNPVSLGSHSEPQPDLAIVRSRDDFYEAAHPRPADILLLIEVADASLIYDRRTKLPLYARSGIAEVWLIDLVTNAVEVHSALSASAHQDVQRFTGGDNIASPALAQLQIRTDEILAG